MGWDGCSSWLKKSDVQKDILKGLTPELKLLGSKSTNRGSHFWMALENASGERFIALYLIEKDGKSFMRKGMTEMSGPAADDCPLALLNLAPDSLLPVADNKDYAMEWRERVRKYAAKMKQNIEIGSVVTIYGNNYTVIGKVKKSYIIESEKDKTRYRCTRKNIAES